MDRKWWTLIAVCTGTFMLLLDVTIVNVALPAIQTSLKANFSDLQWVVDAYSLTLAALLLTTGALADLWGRRLIFVIGLLVFSCSSLASGLADSPLMLNLARGAQGIGGAAMFSTSLALLGSSFQGRERGMAFGVWGAITGLAVAIGPVVGGGLTSGLSWRWIFLVNVPIGVIGVVISLMRVEESKMSHARKPDPIGVVTFSAALAALVYALIKGDSKGWTSPEILGCLIGAGVLMLLFLIAEQVQGEGAMFDLSLFRKPTFTGGALAAFGLSGGLFALFLYLTLYLQDVLGYSAIQTGLRFLVLSGGILLTSTMAGRLTAFVPIRFLIAPGLLMVGIGVLLMRGVTAGTGWSHLIPGFILAGAGTGFVNPPLASTAIGVVRPERAGMASGINSTFRQVGIATGIAGLGAIFSQQVRTKIESLLSGNAQLGAAHAHALANSVASGGGAETALRSLPPNARPVAAHALRAGFAAGLNEVFLVGGILALAAAALSLLLIRSKDFEVGAARTARPAAPPEPPSEAAQAPAASADVTAQYKTPETNGAHPQVEVEHDHLRAEEAGVGQPAAAALSTGAGVASATLQQRVSSYGYHPRSPVPPPPPPTALASPAPGLATPPGPPPDPDPDPPGASDLPTVQDVPVHSDPPTSGAPNTQDVRLVAGAVQSAEEAALAYAREIGEARRHLSAAIEHLDRAEEARTLLNRHAGGFTSHEQDAPPPTQSQESPPSSAPPSSRPASDGPGDPATAAPGVPGAPGAPGAPEAPEAPEAPGAPEAPTPFSDPGAQRDTGPVSTPSPGIAIVEASAAQPTSPRPSDPGGPPNPGTPDPGGLANPGTPNPAAPHLATPNPPAPPPPRPGGWGPGAGGSR